jgi:topoisomerase-4 subunit A
MLGAEGIAVGMATRVLPHNLPELLRAQVACLRKKPFTLYPDFPHGGRMDVSEYDDGRGRVRVRARLKASGPKEIVITEIPFSTTTEGLVASIEAAAQKGKLKVSSIQDFTTEKVEIRLTLPRGVRAADTIPQLYAYSDCEVSISSSITLIHERRPVEMTVTEVLEASTAFLKKQIQAELEHEITQLEDRRHWLTLEQIFIENRVYKRIEKARTDEAVRAEVWEGMQEHALFFVRPMTEEDVGRLLEIRIRRISAYDIARFKKQIDDIVRAVKQARTRLRNLTKTTVAYLEDLLKRHEANWPRRTEITTFESVDKKAVARQTIRVAYDPESGFFGAAVKGGEKAFTLSEYDRVLIVSDDGTYRILEPVDKFLVPGKALYCRPFDPDKGAHFTVVYRDREKLAFGKRVHIHKFIKGREYRLIKDRGGKVALLLQDEHPGAVHLSYVKKPRQRVHESTFDLESLEPTSPSARGARLAPKPVARIKRIRS